MRMVLLSALALLDFMSSSRGHEGGEAQLHQYEPCNAIHSRTRRYHPCAHRARIVLSKRLTHEIARLFYTSDNLYWL